MCLPAAFNEAEQATSSAVAQVRVLASCFIQLPKMAWFYNTSAHTPIRHPLRWPRRLNNVIAMRGACFACSAFAAAAAAAV